MSSTARLLAAAAMAAVAGSIALGAQQAAQPVFRSSVELTSIDLSVVDDRGRTVTDLRPEEFSVRVDGSQRRVIAADWVGLETSESPPAPPPPAGYTGNENATGGRLIMLVIDEPNIRFGGTMGIRTAVNAFIDHLQPSDRAAVIGIGPGAPSTPFTNDRARLKRAVERLVGQHQQAVFSQFSITTFEALQIQRRQPGVLEEVVVRECAGMAGPAFDACTVEVQAEAQEKALTGTSDGQNTINVLRALLNALKTIDGPKTMLLVSEGFILDDQRAPVIELGAIAAAARTSIYALKLDDQLFQSMASEQRSVMPTMDDRYVRAEGLELLTAASRGALFNIIGTGAGVFERIESELSGYYLLGVESSPADRDGKTHSIRIEVARKGLTIRSRRAIVTPLGDGKPKSAREQVAAAIGTPLPIAALPLRVATFSLQGPEPGKVQLLIHADIGSDYAAPRNATVGYAITDRDGRMVDSQIGEARLPPVMNGVPSALQFTGGASVPPGEYTLKLAVNEGDRIGTVEHEFVAGVADAGALKVSDLMAGGPLNGADDLLQPTVGYSVVFGTVHGYVEAYGAGAAEVKAKFELVPADGSEALVSQEVPMRAAGGGTRAIFSKTLPVRQLPPGKYLLRAVLSGAQGALRTLTRGFEIAAPAVLMTSADGGSILSTADVFLPVADAMLSRPFNKGELARDDTLKAFRERVAPPARQAFDTGVSALSSGDYGKAESSFKAALATDSENTAVLAYLAAVFASAGRDDQASGAWQTSLIDGADFPQIYEWLGDALLRGRRLAEARAILDEAMTRWPGDSRFVKPMAMVSATFGQGQQAVRLLERYLEEHPNEPEALQLGVEWIYHLKLARTAAHTPPEDVKLARKYADAYIRLKGPQQALVRRWMEYLEKTP
ncbi:MAG TPA: VWA domain-containing protein [Vicinamibacterales bacterium]|nr:VWA domain-containing protein [Vicinamibacterales bacterium]